MTVELEDGDNVLATAQTTISSLAPMPSWSCLADGQVKTGDRIVLTMPVQLVAADVTYAEFYWLDTPADVPPFHTFVMGTLAPDGSTFQTTALTITGHAAVVLEHRVRRHFGVASSCTGFQSCTASTMTPSARCSSRSSPRLVAMTVGRVRLRLVAALIAGLALWSRR